MSNAPYSTLSRHRNAGIYCTVYSARSPWHSVLDRIHGSPEQRVAAASTALASAGFLTPPIILHGRLSRGQSFVFTERVRGDLLSEAIDGGKSNAGNRLLCELGRCVGQFHASGFLHGRLSTRSVIATDTATGFRFTFLDTEQLVRQRPPGGRGLLKDLSTLSHSAAHIGSRAQARCFAAWHRQMRDLNATEARILAASAYRRGRHKPR